MIGEKSIRRSVIDYCDYIGRDPLLVQGAGGNVSWKEGETLWVKASGTWLSKAKNEDIFVPVNLKKLQLAVKQGHFDISPELTNDSKLRPSIETILHALLPQLVVVHVHAVDILAHLVRPNCYEQISKLIDNSVAWDMVDYFKPGAELAESVYSALARTPNANVIFLKNHGVVIGGNSIQEVNDTLQSLLSSFVTLHIVPNVSNTPKESFLIPEEFHLLSDLGIQSLALDERLFNRLDKHWVLYPDHLVFLGAKAFLFESIESLLDELENTNVFPELIFIKGVGVYITSGFGQVKIVQLRCYYDVLVRQNDNAPLSSLSDLQIAEILNWDAEQYRINLSINDCN